MTDGEFRALLARHPLYRPEDYTYVVLRDGKAFLGWAPRVPAPGRPDPFYLNLEAQPPLVCYLLCIGLKASLRGRGLGHQLYLLAEDVARALGCQFLEMTPSGRTETGESREDYLVRKLGYTRNLGYSVVKDLAPRAAPHEGGPGGGPTPPPPTTKAD